MYQTINPANAKVLAEFPFLSPDDIDSALNSAEEAFRSDWKLRPLSDRATAIRDAGAYLKENINVFGTLITTEMGKPLEQARAEIEKCAWLCEYYARHAEAFLQKEEIDVNGDICFVRFDPLGGVFGIMPWNFPFWQVMRYSVPALLAGNVVLLKPASNVPQCGIHLEKMFQSVIGRAGVFQCLLLDTKDVEQVIASDIVQGVTLTGSDTAGSVVASLAGKHLKKSVMELGGSDPFIVLDDADIDKAASVYVRSRMNNNGQTCIAAKRCFVHQALYDRFISLVREKVSSLIIGDPLDAETDISCLSKQDIVEEVQGQVDKSVEMGAKVLLEGGKQDGTNYFNPMMIGNIREGMPVYDEEVFGPVVVVKAFASDDEVIALANASQYGLGCSIWSSDIDRAKKIAASIEAGSLHINKLVSSDPRVPFGGVKRSGYGRELGKIGIREWVNVKSVTISSNAS